MIHVEQEKEAKLHYEEKQMETFVVRYLEQVVATFEIKQIAESIVKISHKRRSTGLNVIPEAF